MMNFRSKGGAFFYSNNKSISTKSPQTQKQPQTKSNPQRPSFFMNSHGCSMRKQKWNKGRKKRCLSMPHQEQPKEQQGDEKGVSFCIRRTKTQTPKRMVLMEKRKREKYFDFGFRFKRILGGIYDFLTFSLHTPHFIKLTYLFRMT